MPRPALSLSSGLTALALPLALTAALAACDYGEDYHGGNPSVARLDVRTVPSSTPQPGDTLTFYALFPDSTSERYRIGWFLDERGRGAPSPCPRVVCVRWVVPSNRGTYNHAVQVAGESGLSGIPFTTVVP